MNYFFNSRCFKCFYGAYLTAHGIRIDSKVEVFKLAVNHFTKKGVLNLFLLYGYSARKQKHF